MTADTVLVANYINDLLLQVVRSGISWDALMKSSHSVLSFANSILSMRRHSRLVSTGRNLPQGILDMDQAICMCAAEILHDLFYGDGDFTLQDAYAYANPNWTEWVDGSPLEDLGVSEIHTSRDWVEIKPVSRSNTPRLMGLGINGSLQLGLQGLTNQKAVSPEKGEDHSAEGTAFWRIASRISTGEMAQPKLLFEASG